MKFNELELKHCYDSDEDDILNEFYIPVLENSKEYLRLSGFFRSSSLAIAAKGIQGLLKNNGKMKLISGAIFSKNDIEAIKKGLENPEEVIERSFINDLENIKDDFIKDHVQALSWMIAHENLVIKIAIVSNEDDIPIDRENLVQSGIFHQKIGIFKGEDDLKISFNGSANETATAWKNNIEDFNVFREWVDAEKPYLEADINRFNKFWYGRAIRTKIIDVPSAIREKLISISPSTFQNINLDKWIKNTENIKKIIFRPYQIEAINQWVKNNHTGIFEMATGTGKTFTALGCIDKIIKKKDNIVIIISCPYHHLIQQWKKEIDKFGITINKIVADSTNSTWRKEISDALIELSLDQKDKIIILTTHSTFCSKDFADIIKKNKVPHICIVGDEVHGMGAEKSRLGLLDIYESRLGLSATPKRWYDVSGTETIYDYFHDVVFEFPLRKAIDEGFLVPYEYNPKFISLNDNELSLYEKKSRSIQKMYEKSKSNEKTKNIFENEILKRLLFQRANIIKNAEEKYHMLEIILNELGKNCNHVIVYCSPQQFKKVGEILGARGIIFKEFTMEQKTKPERRFRGLSEREHILKNFSDSKYEVLLAMKCLDEGIDIPPARRTILLSSSGNPREYIQRIGRVIRKHPEKNRATIYDIIASPSITNLSGELKELELKIFENELKRYKEIAEIAMNNAESLKLIYEMKNRL